MKLKVCLFTCLCVLLAGCRAPKDVVYFQGIDNLTPEQLESMQQQYSTKIASDDLLSITVSAWDPTSVSPFNPPVFAYSSEGDQPLFPSQSLYTYLVDQNGDIKFPVIGTIHVAGLTRLELASKIYDQKINIARSEHLPSIALMGSYIATSPSVLNSFEKKFKGMWNVGVMVSVPLWHWGEGINKVKAAKSEARIAQYQLEEAKEKIQLQVNQAAFKVNETAKKLTMAEKNLEKANENLRYATLGFEEGVIPASNVLEAHTAWLSAQSEKIDAQIDVKLTDLYLKKATGELSSIEY